MWSMALARALRISPIWLALIAAFVAGAIVNGWRVDRQWQRMELARVLQAEETRAALEASNVLVIKTYRAEIDRARSRPLRRVFLCPDQTLPATAGGTPDPATAGDARRTQRDITDTLIECRAYTLQLRALIDAIGHDPAARNGG